MPEEPPPQSVASTLKAPAAIVVRTVLCHMFLTPKVDTMFNGLRHLWKDAAAGSEKRSEVSSVDSGFLSSNNDNPGHRSARASAGLKPFCSQGAGAELCADLQDLPTTVG